MMKSTNKRGLLKELEKEVTGQEQTSPNEAINTIPQDQILKKLKVNEKTRVKYY